VTRSPSDAFQWYFQAAEKGLPAAQYNVGMMYSAGQGTDRDLEQSLTWYGKAIERDYAEALVERGWLSARGLGVTNSFSEATNWWWKAASIGCSIARRELGLQVLVSTNVGSAVVETVLLSKQTPDGLAAYSAFRRAERELGFQRVSFTDTNGVRFENAAVLMQDPASLYYRSADGGRYGRMMLANLPRDVQDHFGYDPARAAAFEAQRIAALYEAAQRRALEREGKQYAGTFLEKYVGAARRESNDNSEEGKRIATLTSVVAEYAKTHTYLGNDMYQCVDMACDLWNILFTKGVKALIVVGNLDEDIKHVYQANHAWVLAEISPGALLALDPQSGVHFVDDKPRYYVGHGFTDPAGVKEHNPLLKELKRAQEKYNDAAEKYNSILGRYNSASGDAKTQMEYLLIEAKGRVRQAESDIEDINRRRLALFSQ